MLLLIIRIIGVLLLLPHLILITSQIPHLQTPSPWELRLQHMNWVGGVGWGDKHSVHNKALLVLGLFSRSPDLLCPAPSCRPSSSQAQLKFHHLQECCGRLGLHDPPLDVCSSRLLIWQTLHIQGSHTVEA